MGQIAFLIALRRYSQFVKDWSKLQKPSYKGNGADVTGGIHVPSPLNPNEIVWADDQASVLGRQGIGNRTCPNSHLGFSIEC